MHHLVIGEGQIGRAIIERALTDGDTVTVLRRSTREPSPGIRRISGDARDPQVLREAMTGADAVHAAFHTVYDARVWRRELPVRERAVMDVAAERGIPVVFPESMYGFQGAARDLLEGAAPSPQDAKGEVRISLLAARREHAARTVSVIASDLIGPTAVGTGAAVVDALLIEPILAGRRPIVFGDPSAPHTLTFIPDLARAMLHVARTAEIWTTNADRDAVLHAPSAPAPTQREIIAATRVQSRRPERRPWRIPRSALRTAAPVSTFARELHGISGLWYRPCVLRPGVLMTQARLEPTIWQEALRETVAATISGPGHRSVPAVSRS